mmetsp:Transcript_31189/g.47756  ORF Transcript_31189/g.47756 Transcript_31189/m.47756 type:complete len:190 (-) Transcript_31189:2049-2618(-)
MCKFQEYRMEGTLRKFVQEIKFFQRSIHPKRYFSIDFQQAVLMIMKSHDETKEENIHYIMFRDICDCYLPKKDMKSNLPKNWKEVFYLKTSERVYILIAKTLEDRNMWMSGFRYIIASTVTVQEIMKTNNEIMDNKLKQRTKEFQEHQIKIKKTKDKKKAASSTPQESQTFCKDEEAKVDKKPKKIAIE